MSTWKVRIWVKFWFWLRSHLLVGSLQGCLVASRAALAELERETTLQRQAEGISAAKMAGLRFGKPIQVLPDNFNAVISEWKNGKVNAVEAMKKLRMKKPTFYKAIKKM